VVTATGYLLWPFQRGAVTEAAASTGSALGLGPAGTLPDVARNLTVPPLWVSDLVVPSDAWLDGPGVFIGPDDDEAPAQIRISAPVIREAQYVAQVDADHFTARLWEGSVLGDVVVTVRAYTFGRNMADLTPPVSGASRVPILEIDGEWVLSWWLWFIRQC
jgi:hypothetical protein